MPNKLKDGAEIKKKSQQRNTSPDLESMSHASQQLDV
jgi:hypothetical protein